MALNWTMLNPDRSPVPLHNEMTITTVTSGVDLSLTFPDVPSPNAAPSTSASASVSTSTFSGSGVLSATPSLAGGPKKLKAIGRFWLTDQRLIFTSSPANNAFDSLSIPLPSILCTRFEQPTFGSNYLTFEVKPSPEGGLSEGTSVVVRFRDRAMFEFVSLLEKTRERAIYMKRQSHIDEEEEGLPLYSAPAESPNVNMVRSVPVDNPPGYEL
ncbi:hypothetical protein APHAL10511_001541 [Amanita phalloides]|nr:hypothetical protein APHAL10511_001541 [Amanita phalloides]